MQTAKPHSRDCMQAKGDRGLSGAPTLSCSHAGTIARQRPPSACIAIAAGLSRMDGSPVQGCTAHLFRSHIETINFELTSDLSTRLEFTILRWNQSKMSLSITCRGIRGPDVE